jgi:hypothetical protein
MPTFLTTRKISGLAKTPTAQWIFTSARSYPAREANWIKLPAVNGWFAWFLFRCSEKALLDKSWNMPDIPGPPVRRERAFLVPTSVVAYRS